MDDTSNRPLPGSGIGRHWSALIERRSDLILVAAAVAVGLGTGLIAILFIEMLKQVAGGVLYLQRQVGSATGLLLAMGGSGLVVGLMVQYWAGEIRGSGVPEVMEAVAVRRGRIRRRVVVAKVFASALTIGSGGSAGREGPIVHAGAALGSATAQVLHLSAERMRTLAACGAAAGIAATFNAPIAGAIFALEVVLGRFTVRYFGAVVLSSVSGAVVSQSLLSEQPAFQVPAYPLNDLRELPIYVFLSVLAALLAVAFIVLFHSAQAISDRIRVPLWVKTTVGMVSAGALALLLPDRPVLGSGLDFIGTAITADFDLSLQLLGVLLLTKMVATTATLGSGNSGGVFAPALFMGATLGGIVGSVAHEVWPGVVANPGAYAIVGMAALFSAAGRTPITTVLIVFEMSGDYKLILPLMLATVIATVLAEILYPHSIYTVKLARRGIHLTGGRAEDVLSSVSVRDVMDHRVETLAAETTLDELARALSQSHHHGFPIIDASGALKGIVTLADLDRALEQGVARSTPVIEFATPLGALVTVTPGESIGDALQQMGRRGLGRVPVVDQGDPNRLLGLIRRENIITAYNLGLTRRAEWQHRSKQLRQENLDGTEFLDVVLQPEDAAVGKTIQELARELPYECVLVSVRREGRLLIPHGSTQLRAGDQVTAFVSEREEAHLVSCLRGNRPVSGQ